MQAAELEFLEEDRKPALAGQRRRRIARRQAGERGAEAAPGRLQAAPRAADGLVELLAAREVVALGIEAVEIPVALGDALEQLGGQEGALGAHGLEKLGGAACHARQLPAGRKT